MPPAQLAWIALGVATVTAAATLGPRAFREGWPTPLIALGVVVTAVGLSSAIVGAFGWTALYGFLLVLFPVHGLVFGALAIKRRRPRYAVLVGVFAALTGVAWINFHQLDAPQLVVGLRAAALLGTATSIALAIRGRRAARSG